MKQEIIIPTSLSEISLGNYQALLEYSRHKTEEYEVQIRMIELFCGIEEGYGRYLKMQDVKDVSEHINALFDQPQELIMRFEIQGQEFGFHPNINDITAGECGDLEKYINDWGEMHRAMAVLYRPIDKRSGNKYTLTPYNGTAELAELMKLMPVSLAIGSRLFFYNLGRDLSMHFLPSLELPELRTAF